MGAFLSRKKRSSSSSSLKGVTLSAAIESAKEDLPIPELETKKKSPIPEEDKEKAKKKVAEEENRAKKEIFVIKHRKSHDRERPSVSDEKESNISASQVNENGGNGVVRTSSCTKEEVDAILIQCGRLSRSNSSGTKAPSSGRKYTGSKRSFDLDNEADAVADDEMGGETRRHRHRQPGGQPHSSPRRRTPSRERDRDQRSGSRERGSSSTGRRVSRSPNRRSESAPTANSNGSATRPAKMVSVPATVESQTNSGVKRISVKRNVASPRSQSPARVNARSGSNEPTLSRSNSRKAEQSPYRRNPLSEIDPNSLVYAQTAGNHKAKNREAELGSVVKEIVDEKPNVETNNSRVVTRSRSARRSRDFDMNPETLSNPNPSYTALLLEDIQNFHHKNTNTSANANADGLPFTVPACLSKACSILEAVADLNSTTSSNLSCTFSEDKRIPASTVGKKQDPFVESVVASDDLMEPSLHKYVTVRRGVNGSLDMDGQESSGSNSFVGGGSNHHWGYSTSSWEPNSADSTDRWTSRSNTREDSERSPLGFQKHMVPEIGHKLHNMEQGRRAFSGQRTGIGRRADSSKNLHSTPVVAAAST